MRLTTMDLRENYKVNSPYEQVDLLLSETNRIFNLYPAISMV